MRAGGMRSGARRAGVLAAALLLTCGVPVRGASAGTTAGSDG
jgi:hypothetical protein